MGGFRHRHGDTDGPVLEAWFLTNLSSQQWTLVSGSFDFARPCVFVVWGGFDIELCSAPDPPPIRLPLNVWR